MDILIIEDERPAALYLKSLIEQLDVTHKIIAILPSNSELISWASDHEWPDLIFSDIELLDGRVFNSLAKLKPLVPIVFTTAYDHYMQEAFETAGISYILKPYTELQLKEAFNKYQMLHQNISSKNFYEKFKRLEKLLVPIRFKTRIAVKKNKGIYLLSTDEIVYMKMRFGVLHVYDIEGKSHHLSIGLKDLYKQLNPDDFYLINRSAGVSWPHIKFIENYGKERLAVFMKGQKEPIVTSVGRTPGFRKWLDR